jgi:hypothetical protein
MDRIPQLPLLVDWVSLSDSSQGESE